MYHIQRPEFSSFTSQCNLRQVRNAQFNLSFIANANMDVCLSPPPIFQSQGWCWALPSSPSASRCTSAPLMGRQPSLWSLGIVLADLSVPRDHPPPCPAFTVTHRQFLSRTRAATSSVLISPHNPSIWKPPLEKLLLSGSLCQKIIMK